MAKNFVQPGDTIPFTNQAATGAADIKSGSGVLVGSIFGVAKTDIAVGAKGQLDLVGVWDLPKVSAQAWGLGDKIYWATATANCTTTASGNKLIGVAIAAAANPSAAGKVRLNGISI